MQHGQTPPAAGRPLELRDLPDPLRAPAERYCRGIAGLRESLRRAGLDERTVEENVALFGSALGHEIARALAPPVTEWPPAPRDAVAGRAA